VATKRNRAGDIQEIATERLRTARRTAGLSQENVGKKLGLSRSGYGHLEDGSRLLTLDDLSNLSRILGRPIEYFLGQDTGLTEDEGQLLALYRAAEHDEVRALILRLIRSMVQEE